MSTAASPLWAILLISAAATSVIAQPAATGVQPPPAGHELGYRSTFEGYRAFADEKVGSWRDANDTVGRIGGWRAYAKEARQPASAPAAPGGSSNSTTPAPAADPHAGHGKQ